MKATLLLFVLQISTIFCYKFPKDFIFGVATSAYQIEGGWNASDKGVNYWDQLTHRVPSPIIDGSTGDIACDSYNKWREDIGLCDYLGVDFYRFSLSWARILPSGMANHINPDGIRYYNNLINGLLAVGIEPVITLYHWDIPLPLQNMGGWSNPENAQHFEDFADIAFKYFGDRVKKWITINEPNVMCIHGYETQPYLGGVADYMCSKTILIAHARAYRLYNRKYKLKQRGIVGITVPVAWAEPATNSQKDLEAANRFLEFQAGLYLNPIFSKKGNFPDVMIKRIADISNKEGYPRSRLPSFTPSELALVRGSWDFLGLNHYTTWLISHKELNMTEPTSYYKDMGVIQSKKDTWEKSALDWLTVNPDGFRKTMNWVKTKYNNPLTYITENGYGDVGDLQDDRRINYYNTYLKALLDAIYKDGCNVKGYAAWSLMDNMEWLMGYTVKFGLFHVDFEDPERKRTPKASAEFYKSIIANRFLP